ncbi:hypothetical protein B0H13DRAFT_2268863 [Mycena leptocephala]|nr:hypothetical protein B0H13DRAFT_2268863 [Mycena leptocephala]
MSARGDLAHPTLKLQDRSGLVGEAEDEAVELIESMDPDDACEDKFQLHTAQKDNDKDITGTRAQQARASPVGEVEDRVLAKGPFVYWYGRVPIEGDWHLDAFGAERTSKEKEWSINSQATGSGDRGSGNLKEPVLKLVDRRNHGSLAKRSKGKILPARTRRGLDPRKPTDTDEAEISQCVRGSDTSLLVIYVLGEDSRIKPSPSTQKMRECNWYGRTPRYGGDDKAIIVMVKWPPPGRLHRANAAPALPSLYLLLVWTSCRPIAFTDTQTSRPLPSLHEVCLICAGAFGSSNSLARALVVSPHGLQRAQDDGTACEPQAGALAVDALDERLIHVHCPPAPGASLRILRTSSPPYPPVHADSGRVLSSARVGPTLPAAVVVVAQAYIELSRLSYIPHSSLPCAASDSPPVLAHHALAAAFATVHQSRPFAAPNRHPADRTIRFLIAPLTPVLMPVRPSLGPCHWKRRPLSSIFHVAQPSHQPLIVHARASLRQSVHEGVF